LPRPQHRPFEGQALADVLHELAAICAAADTLRLSLEPLTDEQVADGLKPLGIVDVQLALEHIRRIAARIALEHVRAEASEWYTARDEIE
jgi:hypothetical protein